MDSQTDHLRAALDARSSRLVDGGADQLRQLWAVELAPLSAADVATLVDARLASDRFAHFRRPAGETAAGNPPAPARAAADVPRDQQLLNAAVAMRQAHAAKSPQPYGLVASYSPPNR